MEAAAWANCVHRMREGEEALASFFSLRGRRKKRAICATAAFAQPRLLRQLQKKEGGASRYKAAQALQSFLGSSIEARMAHIERGFALSALAQKALISSKCQHCRATLLH
jgi:hypothetical protein